MAALDFTDKAAMLAFIVAKLSSPDSDEIESILDLSSGTKTTDCLGYETGEDGLVTVDESSAGFSRVYRPYLVLAQYPLLYPEASGYKSELYSMLKGASGSTVQFRDPTRVHDRLMDLQKAFDAQLCDIPKGWEALSIGGLKSARMNRG